MTYWWFSFIILFIAPTFVLILINKFRTKWCQSYTCLLGKTTIITGANTGIGLVTALDFAKRGARVILACRNEEKAEEARLKIVEETGNQNISVKLIDMSSFKSVRKFAEDINNSEERLDILVNNAGAADFRDEKTEDGHLFLMQVNYLAPFLLTVLLIGKLKKSAFSRIINVASVGAKYSRNFDVNNLSNPSSDGLSLYKHTKLCNVLFTVELAKKLEGTGVSTYALHPGVVKTDIFRHLTGFQKIVTGFIAMFFKNSEEGAQTTIYTSVEKGIEKYSGGLFVDCQKIPLYKTASDPNLAKQLWDNTELLLHIKPQQF